MRTRYFSPTGEECFPFPLLAQSARCTPVLVAFVEISSAWEVRLEDAVLGQHYGAQLPNGFSCFCGFWPLARALATRIASPSSPVRRSTALAMAAALAERFSDRPLLCRLLKLAASQGIYASPMTLLEAHFTPRPRSAWFWTDGPLVMVKAERTIVFWDQKLVCGGSAAALFILLWRADEDRVPMLRMRVLSGSANAAHVRSYASYLRRRMLKLKMPYCLTYGASRDGYALLRRE